jgi:hypothetical protein
MSLVEAFPGFSAESITDRLTRTVRILPHSVSLIYDRHRHGVV